MAIRDILPMTSETDGGVLSVGGCAVRDLADRFSTPLYIYDEHTIRAMCRAYRREFESRLPAVRVFHAGKALLLLAHIRILVEEGIGVDVVSEGELHAALEGGMPAERIAMNGNAKTPQELEYAVEMGVGRIIVDTMDELRFLDILTAERKKRQTVMLRITPDVDAHTYKKTTTGIADTKFGFPIDHASGAVAHALRASHLDLSGFHTHLGSPIYTTEPYERGVDVLTRFAAEIRDAHGCEWREFSVGGGFAVRYTDDAVPPETSVYAESIANALRGACERHGLNLPELHIEPGRAIVARAGVAVYTVVSRKSIPGVRDYVSVDGGMADNIRCALYDARYTACAPERMDEEAHPVTVAGKYCESGDILVRDAMLPAVRPGDLIAVPASGAYHIPMESNYNMALRPAVVMVRDGEAKLIRRRQTPDDLLSLEHDL